MPIGHPLAQAVGAPTPAQAADFARQFLAERERQDPDGRFLNDYFRGLIRSEAREPAMAG